MNSLKHIGLIAAFMLSAALVCSAGMLATSLLTGMMAPSTYEVMTFVAEATGLLGLTVWLAYGLRAVSGRGRQG